MENPPRKVLIIDTAWLGDVIFTTALIGAVRTSWPDCELHVLVATRGELLVRDHPDVDHVRVYDKHNRERSVGSLFRLARELKAHHYDVILNAHPSFRSRLLTYFTGTPLRVGYRGFLSGLAFTHQVINSLHIEPDHAARRVALLRQLVADGKSSPLKVGISDENRKRTEERFASLRLSGNPILGLIPGSARNTKMWPRENFAEIARRWSETCNGDVLIFGAEREQEVISHITEHGGARCHPVVQEPLDLVAAMLARCTCVLGNDTGVSFLAIAAGAPRVGIIYGCTQVNYEFPAPHRAIEAGVPCCLPRTGHGRARCKWSDQPWCMRQISPDRVWSEIQP